MPAYFKPLPPAEEVRKAFAYDPETGKLTYLVRLARRTKIGDEAGCINNSGYRTVDFKNVKYAAHRIIWLWMTGEDPGDMEVDHENRNKSDNRWANLRLKERSDNLANCAPYANNTSGVKGVYPNGKKWRGEVRRKKVLYVTDTYDTIEEAKIAVRILRAQLYGEHAEHE